MTTPPTDELTKTNRAALRKETSWRKASNDFAAICKTCDSATLLAWWDAEGHADTIAFYKNAEIWPDWDKQATPGHQQWYAYTAQRKYWIMKWAKDSKHKPRAGKKGTCDHGITQDRDCAANVGTITLDPNDEDVEGLADAVACILSQRGDVWAIVKQRMNGR